MSLTIKSSNNFEVDVTTYDKYRKYAVKHKYSVLGSDSTIYNGSSKIEFLYAGKTLIKDVALVDSSGELYLLYCTDYRNYYTSGSVYEHQYVGLKSDNTLLVSNTPVSNGNSIKASGMKFVPTLLAKINTTTHSTSTGYYSDFGIELYHDGTILEKSHITVSGIRGYMYYLNGSLIAVYNHSDAGSIQLSYFGGEVPLSIRHLYLPKNTLLFVCDRNISDYVNSSTPSSSSSSGPTIIATNSIKISISSSLDSIVFEDTLTPSAVL